MADLDATAGRPSPMRIRQPPRPLPSSPCACAQRPGRRPVCLTRKRPCSGPRALSISKYTGMACPPTPTRPWPCHKWGSWISGGGGGVRRHSRPRATGHGPLCARAARGDSRRCARRHGGFGAEVQEDWGLTLTYQDSRPRVPVTPVSPYAIPSEVKALLRPYGLVPGMGVVPLVRT